MSRAMVRAALAAAFFVTVAAAVYPTDEPAVIGPAVRPAATLVASVRGAAAVTTSGPAVAPETVSPPARASAGLVTEPGSLSAASGAAPQARGSLQASSTLDLSKLGRKPSVIEGGNPFVLPPPPPPPAPRVRKAMAPPAPPPQAPPLPFHMIGSLNEDGKVTIFAARANGDVVSLRVADIVDNTYRVDSINNQQMTLTYLPLNQKQTLPVGATQ